MDNIIECPRKAFDNIFTAKGTLDLIQVQPYILTYLALSQICRQLGKEARELFYGKNVFSTFLSDQAVGQRLQAATGYGGSSQFAFSVNSPPTDCYYSIVNTFPALRDTDDVLQYIEHVLVYRNENSNSEGYAVKLAMLDFVIKDTEVRSEFKLFTGNARGSDTIPTNYHGAGTLDSAPEEVKCVAEQRLSSARQAFSSGVLKERRFTRELLTALQRDVVHLW